MPQKECLHIFWFRRDLRLNDNHGLFRALQSGNPVLPLFIFDTEILKLLNNRSDSRISFIYQQIKKLKQCLEETGSSLWVMQGKPIDVFSRLCRSYRIKAVFANHDYEPYATKRDNMISEFLSSKSIPFHTYKDQVIFEKSDVVKNDGKPYSVFTPYCRKWKSKFDVSDIEEFSVKNSIQNFYQTAPLPLPELSEIGFTKADITFPSSEIPIEKIKKYDKTRDFPALEGTSRLGVHLRFGTISIRNLIKKAAQYNEIFLNELIWREFYMMILHHFPHVVHGPFKKKYENLAWRNREDEFTLWCEGKTGFPIVDAAMTELNQSGYMHNRCRMFVAGFLTKHLLIDWRWGEAYFADKLLDYELASNNGGWQWAASTGCDAVPYFRIFNPWRQEEKFDPDKQYIKKWLPQWSPEKYIEPIVEHRFARQRALETYKKV